MKDAARDAWCLLPPGPPPTSPSTVPDRSADETHSENQHYTQQTQLAPAPLLEHAHGVHFKTRGKRSIINSLHPTPSTDRQVQ